MLRVSCEVEVFPIAGRFSISRGSKTEAKVVVASVSDGTSTGRGECVPYARYGESIDSVVASIESVSAAIEALPDRTLLQRLLPAGAARSALDCALWDYEAKQCGRRAAETASVGALKPVVTAYTISAGTPEVMADAARKAAGRPLLKVKLAGDGDGDRLAAVREAAPDATFIVDANESWRFADLATMIRACADAGVKLIEQPLPADDDADLARIEHLVPICADESSHDRHGLADLRGRYDCINIKLDKAGGLTEALALARQAKDLGFSIMVGCMVGTSLAMAPAMLLTPWADYVDLDGPLLLAQDRPNGLRIEGSTVFPPDPALWG